MVWTGADPIMAVQLMVDLSLFSIVFLLPQNLDVPQYGDRCLATLQAGIQILQATRMEV